MSAKPASSPCRCLLPTAEARAGVEAMPLCATLTAADLAHRLGVSVSQIWKLHDEGKLPAPLRLGCRKVLWLCAEIDSWLDAGAPDRDAWNRLLGRGDPS